MDLKDRLRETLTDAEMEQVVTSFDIVGDIAIIKVPDELEHRKGVIADAVLAQHKNVSTVIRKTGERTGEYRVADYEVLRGSSTETIHREHGCRFKLDPTTVYFSERLGHERERVMNQVEPEETVVDMFAGIGPFTILIARNTDVGQVHAFEKNPAAVSYLEENVSLNKVEETVTVHSGDVGERLPETDITADRIIMNLPKSAEVFLDAAATAVESPTIIHFYTFAAKEDIGDPLRDRVTALFAENGLTADIQTLEICGHYNPAVERVCVDVVAAPDTNP